MSNSNFWEDLTRGKDYNYDSKFYSSKNFISEVSQRGENKKIIYDLPRGIGGSKKLSHIKFIYFIIQGTEAWPEVDLLSTPVELNSGMAIRPLPARAENPKSKIEISEWATNIEVQKYLLHNLGANFERNGEFHKSFLCFDHLSKLSPENSIALYGKALCKLRSGNFTEALNWAEKARALEDSLAYIYFQSLCNKMLENFAEAERYYNEVRLRLGFSNSDQDESKGGQESCHSPFRNEHSLVDNFTNKLFVRTNLTPTSCVIPPELSELTAITGKARLLKSFSFFKRFKKKQL